MSPDGRPKVLLVDDVPANLFAMRHVLADLDCELQEACSGEEALAQALRRPFAVILLDVQMPGMDGFETASLLRGATETARTPIIFVTAFDSGGESVARGYELGAVDYLFKPVDSHLLRCKVEVFLELDRQRRELDVMDELQRSQAQLERSNRDLEQFVRTISHDLREPLRSVSSHLQLVERRFGTALGEDGARWIGYAVSGAKRMHALIGDLLRFSQVGGTAGPGESADSEAVLDTVLMDLCTCIEDAGAVIEHDALPTVSAHRSEVALVLQNLLANAIRYRGPEPPRIRIGARVEGEQAVFSVRDNGQGIEERHFEKIFGVFERLDPERLGGTGIGLAIVKRLVERRGGRIWVESSPGEGSTFHFSLPRAESPEEKDPEVEKK